jgi:hypothetical protein
MALQKRVQFFRLSLTLLFIAASRGPTTGRSNIPGSAVSIALKLLFLECPTYASVMPLSVDRLE